MSKKKKIVIGVVVIILTILPFVAWTQYEVKKSVCEISQGRFCYNVMPMPEKYRKKLEREWKEKNPGKDL